ncbi:hypothetical protein [Kamptonema sp. UHCC 0994]|uniref:hypothetical protein n=1 Tax=Kamptonema sp. UHCC 0994 TaxID=3031329 RepID=UPI0023B96C6E|nr:hypothetical protein [Kamptonema sp. UHCC 0994]MDF0553115.1 hypothetical protein [Kamptonema sp. UHCC 0994]
MKTTSIVSAGDIKRVKKYQALTVIPAGKYYLVYSPLSSSDQKVHRVCESGCDCKDFYYRNIVARNPSHQCIHQEKVWEYQEIEAKAKQEIEPKIKQRPNYF